MKLLFIACLALSTAAFAESATATKSTTTKKAYVPERSEATRDSSMKNGRVEAEKTKSTSTHTQKMEDENHMPTDTSSTVEKINTETEE